MARPLKYSDETAERICDGIRLGLTYRHAARYGGIDYSTFNAWMHRYSKFSEAVGHANATAAAVNMANIKAHATDDWRAAAWILEHRFPDDYGSRFSDSMSDPLADSPVRRIIVERVNRAEREPSEVEP